MSSGPSGQETVIKAGLSLVPAVGGALASIYGDWRERRRATVERLAAVTLSRYPGTAEDFVRRLREDARLASLFVGALESAAGTAIEEKVTALGLLLGDAASTTDGQSFDETELLTLALVDIEWPHIRALRDLANYPSDSELEAEGLDASAVSDDPRRRERLSLVSSLPRPVVAALVRHGLVSENAGYGLYVEGITSFGRALLRYLEPQVSPG